MGSEVLDLVFRRPGSAVGFLDLISSPDDDPILYGGALASTDGSSRIHLTIEAAQADLSATSDALQQISEAEFAILTEDGETSGFGITAFSSVSLIDDQWQLNSGTFNDPDGSAIDFFAATDPVPAVVWIAGIGVIGCLLKVGIDALLLNCREQVSENIKACSDAGGLPSVTIATTYGFGRVGNQVQIGCNATCLVECRGTP
jgi:hypothetical protein